MAHKVSFNSASVLLPGHLKKPRRIGAPPTRAAFSSDAPLPESRMLPRNRPALPGRLAKFVPNAAGTVAKFKTTI